MCERFLEYSQELQNTTICPRSSDPFYIVTYNKKWVTTSWTHSILQDHTAIVDNILCK